MLEVGELGAGAGDLPGVLAKVPPYELSEELVEVNLAHSLHRAEGERGGAAVRGLRIYLDRTPGQTVIKQLQSGALEVRDTGFMDIDI